MRYRVYPNPQGASGCLIIPEDTLIGDLPENIQGRFGEAKVYRLIDLDPRQQYAGLEVSEVMRNIARKGFHILGVSLPTIDKWPGQQAEAS